MMTPATPNWFIKNKWRKKFKKLDPARKILAKLEKYEPRRAFELEELIAKYEDDLNENSIKIIIKALKIAIEIAKTQYKIIEMEKTDPDADYWDLKEAKEGLKELY